MARLRVILSAVGLLATVACGSGSDRSGDGASGSVGDETLAPLSDAAGRTYRRGLTALRRGEFDRALDLADRLDRSVPPGTDRSAVFHLRAEVYKRLNRWEEADRAYTNALEIDGRDPGIWFERGHLAFRRNTFPAALRRYRRSLSLLDAQREEVQEGNARNGSAETAARPLDRRRAAVLHQIGRTQMKMARTDSARSYYERALSADSTYAAAHADLARWFEDRGRLERASELAERARDIEPEEIEYRYLAGKIAYLRGNYDEAVSHLRTVVSAKPWHRGGHYHLGHALLRTERSVEADDHLRRAESLASATREIERLREELAVSGGDPGRWLELARALDSAGRTEEARTAYRVGRYGLNP